MKNILLISLLLTLYTGYSFAQCGANQVEVKVDILTDPWGEETYWTLSDLQGTIVLQGGQGGVYLDNTSYSDSICVSSSSCLVFEIYDTWGDGIFTPAACELYVDGLLVYSGSNNIGSYASTLVNCSDSCVLVLDALNDLHDHINATITLTPVELTSIKNIFTLFPGCLAISESNILLSKSVVADYDSLFGALFTTPGTQNGFSKDPAIAPGMELERAMIALQQGIFDEVFTSGVYGNYPQHLNGWKYGACTTFPGFVAPPADSTIGVSVPIRANFEDPDGMNPYYEINGDGTDHALRPTGLYLSPGSVATVTVPDSLVGQDYWIKVGSHDWDLTNREMFLRFDRISKKFLINSNTIEVFNPLGGAISILVPYGADDGIVQVTVNNGVEAPFFSLKSFYETTDFNAELSKPGPWAVFETDNVMFTIPKHAIVPGQYDLMQTLVDWETALRGMNSILARQIIPDKHNMYMIADVDIRVGVYSIGYPMSNTPLNYTDVPGPAYFLNGPGPDDEINFHELGHALALSQFSGEEEALVNFPYVMALNYGLGVDLNEAVANSLGTSTIDIDNAAIHRLISSTFGSERNISDSEMNEVRYQHRGFGHYFEIVNILGWCPLRNFWKQEAIDFENGINYGSNDDKRIVRMSVAAQADLRPLFHVFGIIAQDPVALQDTLNQLGIQPSLAIYNRLQDYLDLIPQDNAEFVNSAIDVYPDLYTAGPTGNPNYGVGWFYLKSLSYNTAEAQIITNTLQSIINLYYPNGQPAGGNTNLCCLLDPLQLNMVNQEVVVTGGVEPYQISIDTTGNVMTVTVVDFDGCGSTDQFTITGFTEENPQGINIYPNPASTEIYIDLKRNNEQIENLRIVSFQGQVLNQSRRTDRVNVSALREGVYLLQIELAGGEQISKKVLILR
jgi:hypothetical protein